MNASPENPAAMARGLVICDAVERVIVLLLYAFLTERVLNSFIHTHNPFSLLVLFSEGFVVLFVLLRRRARHISLRARDWILALAGTTAPLLVEPSGGLALAPAWLCAGFMLLGLCLQVAAKVTLGRGFGLIPANRGVIAKGPYRLLRHPMYAGYILTHIGFFLGNAIAFNGAIYLAELALQISRLAAEERLLARDPDYLLFKSQVRYRLIPGVF